MWDGFVGKHIRRSDRNMLVANLGLVLVPLAIGVGTARYWSNFAAGPLKIDRQALIAIQNPEATERYFVTVKGDKSIDTGLEQITQRKNKYSGSITSQTVSAKFVALLVDQKLLIVKSNADHVSNVEFTGELVPVPSEVQRQVISDAVSKNPKMKDVFLPFMLQETDFRTSGYIGLALGLPCVLLGLWNLQKVGKRWGKPEQHPIAKALTAKGEASSVASQVEAELQSGATDPALGNTRITRSWLFQPSFFGGLTALPLDHLIWAYKKVTTRRTYGIPVGKSWAAVVCDRDGKSIEIGGKEDQVDQLLQSLWQKAPWVVGGYSDELQKLWTQDRSKFLEAVDLRRQQGT